MTGALWKRYRLCLVGQRFCKIWAELSLWDAARVKYPHIVNRSTPPIFSPQGKDQTIGKPCIDAYLTEFIHDVPVESQGNKSLLSKKPFSSGPHLPSFLRSFHSKQQELVETKKEESRGGRETAQFTAPGGVNSKYNMFAQWCVRRKMPVTLLWVDIIT